MKSKKSGFTSIECIVSLSIICIASYIVYESLYNCYNLANRNIKNIEMLNIARSYIEDEKYLVKNTKPEFIEEFINRENKNNYEIQTKLEKVGTDKNQEYYQCYKINLKVIENSKYIELDSYVTTK